MTRTKRLVLAVLLMALTSFADANQGRYRFVEATPSAFDSGGYRPHYQGPGYNTTGGRGGELVTCTINTLTVSGGPTWGSTGDLRDCLAGVPAGCDVEAATIGDCARYVLSSVSGTVDLGGNEVYITAPFLTVAGQTAPRCSEGTGATCTGADAGGLLVKNGTLKIVANDVVLQHLRLRAGETYCCHSLYIGDPQAPWNDVPLTRTVIDHLSVTWGGFAGNSNSNAYGNSSATGIYDSIFAEPFWTGALGGPNFGWVGIGGTSTDCQGVTLRVLFATAWYRMPWIGPGCQVANVNSLAYNAAANGEDNGGFSQLISDDGFAGFGVAAIEYTAVRNVYLEGPNTSNPLGFLSIAFGPDQAALDNEVYLNGNIDDFGSITGPTGSDQWAGVLFCNCGFLANTSSATEGAVRIDSPPTYYSSVNYRLLAAADVAAYVRLNAGAFPLERDAVDARIATDTTEGTGGSAEVFIDQASDVGGYPTIAARSWTLSPPASPEAVNTGNAGFSNGTRTNMEWWLETLARRVEVSQGVP